MQATKIRTIALMAAALTTACPVSGADLASYVDDVFGELIAEHDIPGLSVAIILDGETQFFNYGVASRTAGTSVSEHTIFEVGSISKIFTATLGGHAIATGRMSLGDHPSQYLSWLAGSAVDQASVLNLATYTAGGLPLQFPEGVEDESDIEAYFTGWMPDAAPDVQRRYSNPSIGLFGRTVAAALDDDFGELVERHVIGALGMESTYMDVPEVALGQYAWGHREGAEIRVNPGPLDTEAYGIKSTTADLARLVQANLSTAGLEQELRQAIEATQVGYFQVGPMTQGLGWEQYPFPVDLDRLVTGNSPTISGEANPALPLSPAMPPEEPTLFNKTGSTSGFGGYVAFVPAYRIGIVMLANRNFPNAARVEAAHDILNYLAGQP